MTSFKSRLVVVVPLPAPQPPVRTFVSVFLLVVLASQSRKVHLARKQTRARVRVAFDGSRTKKSGPKHRGE